ncbi:uncharacterized protein (TIGR03083 family) [Herbihabitans rhizosphaerae]|uniref:Uncharacterized protein (TIGR03083 family) n=1 Tax=Herbihabitans rhizosphaerae TaxID=1872711 RepID=A0A4Q7KR89_9PSEU|nr:maleylpyruvate isomerase family mycothiol-dependent enzyme [Herbihabitans rhizosphaerae]RZS38967.1 uncharacterized protein (TIGR03083 family) [Herbihabitans rhizosphaerae]
MNRPLIDYGRLLEVIGIEARLVARSAEGASEDARVPNCPGLTLGEAVRHLGGAYRTAKAWIESGDSPATWQAHPAPGQSLVEFFLAGQRELVEVLVAHDAEEACATWWTSHQNYGFWRRRMAHETTIHRYDVQGALGSREDIDEIPDDVAIDGVDEALTLWFEHRLSVLGMVGTTEKSVAVRVGEHIWRAKAGPSGTSATRVAPEDVADVDAEITGTAEQVYLWLWGRMPTYVLPIDRGRDPDAVAQLWALMRLATK